jgi:predicted RNA binding protein YcfA (HicA-like mRNA interferase family)
MKVVTGTEPCRALERKDWRLLRTQGSHRIYGKEGSGVRLSVPVHAGSELKAGLLRHLLRMAGLEEHDL